MTMSPTAGSGQKYFQAMLEQFGAQLPPAILVHCHNLVHAEKLLCTAKPPKFQAALQGCSPPNLSALYRCVTGPGSFNVSQQRTCTSSICVAFARLWALEPESLRSHNLLSHAAVASNLHMCMTVIVCHVPVLTSSSSKPHTPGMQKPMMEANATPENQPAAAYGQHRFAEAWWSIMQLLSKGTLAMNQSLVNTTY